MVLCKGKVEKRYEAVVDREGQSATQLYVQAKGE